MLKLNLSEFDNIEVIDIPKYTMAQEDAQNEIKNKIMDWQMVSQVEKDVLDYLQFLEAANNAKGRGDTKLALACYKRALWERKYWFKFLTD